jgi:hypothetical protein
MLNTKGAFLCLVKALCIVVTVFLTGSCSTTRMYSGPELPASQTALIRGADTTINLVSCDGKKFSSTDVIVLPGEHTIEMGFSGGGSYSLSTTFAKFNAEAGHIYSIDKKLNSPGRYSAFTTIVMDITTGNMVSTRFGVPQWALQERLTIIDKSTKDFPQNAQIWVDKGETLVRLGKYDEALPALDRAISINSDHAGAWATKGWALYELRRYEDALIATDRGILFNPKREAYQQFRKIITNAIEGRPASREEIEKVTGG